MYVRRYVASYNYPATIIFEQICIYSSNADYMVVAGYLLRTYVAMYLFPYFLNKNQAPYT